MLHHRVARDWRRTVDIKPILYKFQDQLEGADDEDDLAQQCAAELKEFLLFEAQGAFRQVIDHLGDVITVGDLDALLEDLYDTADDKSILVRVVTTVEPSGKQKGVPRYAYHFKTRKSSKVHCL